MGNQNKFYYLTVSLVALVTLLVIGLVSYFMVFRTDSNSKIQTKPSEKTNQASVPADFENLLNNSKIYVPEVKQSQDIKISDLPTNLSTLLLKDAQTSVIKKVTYNDLSQGFLIIYTVGSTVANSFQSLSYLVEKLPFNPYNGAGTTDKGIIEAGDNAYHYQILLKAMADKSEIKITAIKYLSD